MFSEPSAFWLKSMRSACSLEPGPSAALRPSLRGAGANVCAGTFVASAALHSASVAGAPTFLASCNSFAGLRTEYSFASSLSASVSSDILLHAALL